MRRRWRCVWMGLWVSACAGDLRDPERFEFLLHPDAGTASDAQSSGAAAPPGCVTTVFKMKCSMSFCHDAKSMVLDLASAQVEKRLVDKAAYAQGACSGKTLVPTQGDEGLFKQKLSNDPGCGAKMPLTGTLSTAELACLNDWVDSVAHK